jgi:predicted MFS family arabinose efflux permease
LNQLGRGAPGIVISCYLSINSLFSFLNDPVAAGDPNNKPKAQGIHLMDRSPVNRNPMYRYLIVLTIGSTAGLQIWRTLFNNFAVDVVGLNGQDVGIIQSIRELPGFLALLAVYVILIVREHRLSALSVLILGLGVAATGLLPSFGGLMITTLIMSFGFHYYETTNQSLTLQYFDQSASPWVFGKQRSFAAASSIAVGILIYLVEPHLSYTWLYGMLGSLIIAAGIWGMRQDPSDRQIIPQHKRMILRRKYWLFYFLTFMAGARRQIFIAFAVFLMVKVFNFTVRDIALLFLINNAVNYFLSPMIGRAIIRHGERLVLSVEYASLMLIFMGYALTTSKVLVCLLYVLDHISFNFAIAIRTYFQKVSDPRDIAPSMAVGFTINHIAAVILPAIGGLVWMIDYRWVFIGAAGLSLVSLIAVQRIKTRAS